MTAARRTWSSALTGGLLWGAVAVFVSLVGMVEVFAGRFLIVGVISLGHALLLLTGLGNGIQAARRGSGRIAVLLVRGTLAGAAAGAVMGALLTLGTIVNLRQMFINASPLLFEILSFGRGAAGIPLVILIWAGVGLVGAATTMLPSIVRGSVSTGLALTLSIGLFQELLQSILEGGGLRGAIRDLFFTPEGLPLRGALLIFALTAGLSVLWRARGGAARSWMTRRPAPQRRLIRGIAFSLALGVALVLPNLGGLFISQVLVLVGLFTLMGLGLNLEVGFAGLLDLGFVAFFAIGAYTVGLLTALSHTISAHWSFWAAVPIALVVSLFAGFLFGMPILRIRGDYLAIATLGFGEIIRLLVLSDALRPWLGGSQGVLGIPRPAIGPYSFDGPMQIYYITLAASALIAFVGARLRDSRLGRAWMALREDEDVAEAMGISLVNVKLLAYGIGGAFAGMSGAIFAILIGSVFPHSFSFLTSINVLALIIVGGMGSQPGVVVGSLFLVGLPELLREFSDFRYLVYGAALVIMMQLRPEGLWPAAVQRRELHAAEEPAAVLPEEAAATAGGE